MVLNEQEPHKNLMAAQECSYRELDNNLHALYGLYKLLIEINGR